MNATKKTEGRNAISRGVSSIFSRYSGRANSSVTVGTEVGAKAGCAAEAFRLQTGKSDAGRDAPVRNSMSIRNRRLPRRMPSST